MNNERKRELIEEQEREFFLRRYEERKEELDNLPVPDCKQERWKLYLHARLIGHLIMSAQARTLGPMQRKQQPRISSSSSSSSLHQQQLHAFLGAPPMRSSTSASPPNLFDEYNRRNLFSGFEFDAIRWFEFCASTSVTSGQIEHKYPKQEHKRSTKKQDARPNQASANSSKSQRAQNNRRSAASHQMKIR